MPANAAELEFFKKWARAMLQMIEAIEARDKAEASAPSTDAAPGPRLSRIT